MKGPEAPTPGGADLVIRNGLVVDPIRETVEQRDLTLKDGKIYSFRDEGGREVFDAKGLYVAPGFIDSHLHVEGLHLLPAACAPAFLSHGTTAIVTDLHEIANAGGMEGLTWYMERLDAIPLDVFVMAPSCVPSSPFERGRGVIGVRELVRLRRSRRVIGLGEVMDMGAVIDRDRPVMAKIKAFSGMPVDGHAPGLRGEALSRYLSAGICSDHEVTEPDEAEEKLGAGMHLFLRNGSVAKDLAALSPVIRSEHLPFLSLCTDDLSAADLFHRGHMDLLLRLLVKDGVPLARAVRLATTNGAAYFNLTDRRAPGVGRKADLVIFEDPGEIRVKATVKDGRIAWREGETIYAAPDESHPPQSSLSLAHLTADDLRAVIPSGRVRLMTVTEGSIMTGRDVADVGGRGGYGTADAARDILLACVFDRYRGEEAFGFGFVRGFGLKGGAIASTYAHDAHNLIVVGDSVEDILAAREMVRREGGGMAVVRRGKRAGSIPMPAYGIISTLSAREFLAREAQMAGALREMGTRLSNPFFQMSFLSLPVIPELRLTTRGLFDVTLRKYVPVRA